MRKGVAAREIGRSCHLVENARERGCHVQRVVKAPGGRDEIENRDLLDGLIAPDDKVDENVAAAAVWPSVRLRVTVKASRHAGDDGAASQHAARALNMGPGLMVEVAQRALTDTVVLAVLVALYQQHPTHSDAFVEDFR